MHRLIESYYYLTTQKLKKNRDLVSGKAHWFARFLFLVSGVLLAGCAMFEKYEEPGFTVVKRDSPFDIRQYKPYVVAEVMAKGVREDAANDAFRILFNYITGNNAEKAKMAMTIPVIQQKQNENWAIHFVMPLSKELEALPKPDDNRITLRRTAPGRMLAIVFSGTSAQANLDENTQKLLLYAQNQGIHIKGKPLYAFYNSPFSLPFLRRNEILFSMEP